MSTLTAHTSSSNPGVSSSSTLFPPGWPFIWFFVGYPIWWILGITEIVPALAAGVMIVHLTRRKSVWVPRHFGIWLLFLVCAGLGIFLVHVDAPGAVPQGGFSPYLTWAYRFLTLIEATIFLVYVCTLRTELPRLRIVRTLGTLFIYVAIGGFLGVVAPFTHLTSLSEFLLPHRLATEPFVNSLIHPTLAQVQTYLGDVNARPSAPFPYANSWGHNYICFLPFFVMGWKTGPRRRQLVGAVVLAISIVPLIYSEDRAVWASAAVIILLLAIYGAIRGNARTVATSLLVCVLLALILVMTPLGGSIQSRLSSDTHNSNQGRTNLSTLAVKSAATGSPVLGFGTTRQMQGSFQSIATGSTPSCPKCSLAALGTQGVVWFLIFSCGFAGFLLYSAFYILGLLRSLRRSLQDQISVVSASVLIVFFMTAPVYGLRNTTEVAAMSAVALASRTIPKLANSESRDSATPALNPLGRYTDIVLYQGRLLVACTVCGLLLGGIFQLQRGSPYVATTSILVKDGDTLRSHGRPLSLDTVAQLAHSSRVERDIKQTMGENVHVDRDLHVSAYPNTRILNLTFTSDTYGRARQGVDQASKSLTRTHWRLGRTTAQPQVRRDGQGWLLSPLSAGALGLSVGTILGRLQESRGPRLRGLSGGSWKRSHALPPLLGVITDTPGSLDHVLGTALRDCLASECFTADDDPIAHAAVKKVRKRLRKRTGVPHNLRPSKIVLFASCRSRAGQLLRAQQRWAQSGVPVSGVVIAVDRAPRRHWGRSHVLRDTVKLEQEEHR